MRVLPQYILDLRKRKYPEGRRVKLLKLNIPDSLLKPGDKGTVNYVDNGGTIQIDWDNGISFGAVFGEAVIIPIVERTKVSKTKSTYKCCNTN